jgi:hypothetical protein
MGQITLISLSWAHWLLSSSQSLQTHTNPGPHWTSTWQNIKIVGQHISPFPSDCLKSLTKNYNLPLYDWPHNFNGLLQFFGVPKNQGTLSWNASQQNPYTNQPKHTLWEKFLAAFEISELLIIPLINQQNQLLDRNYASLSTLCSGFSCTFIRNRDLKTNLPNPFEIESQKPFYLFTLLHILPPLHREIFAKRTSFGSSLAP